MLCPHFVNVVVVYRRVERPVEVIEKLDGLSGRAHRGQVCETTNVAEKYACTLVEPGLGLLSCETRQIICK